MRPLGELMDFLFKCAQVIAHQKRLLQEMIEWMVPLPRFDAGDKRCRMADQYYHIEGILLRQPLRREKCQRVTQQRPVVTDSMKCEQGIIPHHSSRVFPST